MSKLKNKQTNPKFMTNWKLLFAEDQYGLYGVWIVK